MLHRIDDFFDFLEIDETTSAPARELARATADDPQTTNAYEDYCALAAAALHRRPARIFEIGTFRGVTSDFLLRLLPESRMVSIAYVRSLWRRMKFNNSQLSRREVGRCVAPERRNRYHQLFGSSHDLTPARMIEEFGTFDMIFIDGDHSAEGVRQDTELAMKIISDDGVICWHDANPKEKYLAVREYLENMRWPAIATADTYRGGIACWSPSLAERLSRRPQTSSISS